MARFSNFRSYFSSVSRGLLLVVGLVVVVGLVAATFLYDDNAAEVASDNQTQEESSEGTVEGNVEEETGAEGEENTGDDQQENGQEAAGSDDDAENSEAAGSGEGGDDDTENTVTAPAELAQTGPEHVAFATFMLGATVYGYRRSSRTLAETIRN